MILVDVNLLVDASHPEGRDQAATRAWWTSVLRGPDRVGLPWAALTGFVRVSTQPAAWGRPAQMEDSLAAVRDWLARPNVWIPEPGPRHFEHFARLLDARASWRHVADAHLAALALEHGLEVCSRDGGFAVWERLGLRWRDPIS